MSISATAYAFALLALCSLLQLPGAVVLRFIGIAGLLAFGTYGVIRSGQISRTVVQGAAIITLLSVATLIHATSSTYNLVVSVIFILATALLFSLHQPFSTRQLARLATATAVVIPLADLASLLIRHTTIFTNGNIAAIAHAALLLFYIGNRHLLPTRFPRLLDLVVIGSASASLYLSGGRSALIGAVLGLAYLVFTRRQGIWRMSVAAKGTLILAYSAFNVALIFFYTRFADTPLAGQLNELSRHYFQKNAFSGREDRWSEALDLLSANPLYGSGVSYLVVDDTGLSFHNLALHIGVQYGALGIVAVLLTFALLLAHVNCRTEVALVILLMVASSFEVFLLQNNIGLGLFVVALIYVSRRIQTETESPQLQVNETDYSVPSLSSASLSKGSR
ncbi:hypothetical protein QR90_12720 [Deinococcus radiopugnans]|uniref:O-antigen ligase-related domain-containing protein n=1 Tax=Deinococcus radiopugnans TaxID=57497 RepID=A0A0A7KI21_9DEIO|nr:O-antigen ligase family protein [Deinococcus radiopugnans]AIZ45750.1 hypothetical protein QR90_12720 [Deinococcus radiopugnans]